MKNMWRLLPLLSIAFLCTLLPGCRSVPSSEQHLADRLAEWNIELYAAARDYIRNDTAARRILNHPEPIPVLISDEAECFTNFYYWQWNGWLTWMGLSPQGSEEQRRILDSLYRHAKRTRCQTARNPALVTLSTTDDTRYLLEFRHIDSTFFSDKYIVSAYLWLNPKLTRDTRDYDTGLFYSVVLDRNHRVLKAFSKGADSYPGL